MGLLPDSKRKSEAAARGAVDPSDAVAQARTKARRRLIGATVLLGVGIIGFPLVFETAPRPIPVDLPIEIPRKEGAPPLAMPPARPASPAAPSVPAPRDDVITESRSDAGREVASPAPAASAAAPAAAKPSAPAPAPAAAPGKASAPAKVPAEAKAAAPADAARAQALLEGKPAAAKPPAAAPEPPKADAAKPEAAKNDAAKSDAAKSDGAKAEAAGRFIVQVGAFAEQASAREMRLKVEKLGLKTYTQVTETSSGSRIRVRLGPFATRDEAERALARAKAAGVDGVVLAL
jgi:DedD protein